MVRKTRVRSLQLVGDWLPPGFWPAFPTGHDVRYHAARPLV